MSHSAKAKPSYTLSKDLGSCKLPKKYQSILAKFEEMSRYMELSGNRPESLYLYPSDWREIDAAVQVQSDGRRTLDELTFRGVPVLRHAPSPQVDAFA